MKSGAFQSMNLSRPLMRAIYKKGYRTPTPIQRKTIPVIMDGRDVVAMARTGSGKTAAFLIPIIERLKAHKAVRGGARALILSPTRELALQTYKFAREFAKFTDLKCETILGGDSMEVQFAKIHENPDIIIATPGRLLHVAIEMNLKFANVEMVVFDEADRLFELGFKEQLNEIVSRMSRRRQTLLFSATLPETIVDFTKAGLKQPELIRLDTENTISENLRLVHLSCRNEDKLAALLHLLKCVIKPQEQTIVFLPTRHHIEYIKEILDQSSIRSTYLYSSLDSEARKINIKQFHSKHVNVLLVTDLAARGVDIPLLDNVINFNFPSKPKLFVHRVGRTARAGRSGTAYSFVANDELPYLFSLSLFLSNPFKVANPTISVDDDDNARGSSEPTYGTIPQSIVDEENECVEKLHQLVSDLDSMVKVCDKAYKQYLKTRQTADPESVAKMKRMLNEPIGYHPLFFHPSSSTIGSGSVAVVAEAKNPRIENERVEMLNSIRSYKPQVTIFELSKTKTTGKQHETRELMKLKRKSTENLIRNKQQQQQQNDGLQSEGENFRDKSFYLDYQCSDFHREKGLQIDNTFNLELKSSILDFDGDENGKIAKNKNQLKWDRKKKKFINLGQDEPKSKKIRTESGNLINASYKSGMYEKWQQKSKINYQAVDDGSAESRQILQRNREIDQEFRQKRKEFKGKRLPKQELKTPEQIKKERKRKEKIREYQKTKHHERERKRLKSNKKAGKGRTGKKGKSAHRK